MATAHTGFLQDVDVHIDFEQDLLFSIFKIKKSQAPNTCTMALLVSTHTRSCQELPYSADWSIIDLNHKRFKYKVYN